MKKGVVVLESLVEAVQNIGFRAFITNLGRYNEGELVGEWVEFPIDREEFDEVLEKIGIGSTDEFGNPYEEWFVTDYDFDLPFDWDWKELGEYPSYDELNNFGELLESITNPTAVKNIYEALGGTIEEAVDAYESGDCIFYPDVTNEPALAELVIDEMYGGVEELPKELIEKYVDFDMLGRDLSFDSYEDADGNEITAGEFFCGDENATDAEIGEAFYNEVGADGVGNLYSYFDLAAYGNELSSYGDFVFTHDGVVECLN